MEATTQGRSRGARNCALTSMMRPIPTRPARPETTFSFRPTVSGEGRKAFSSSGSFAENSGMSNATFDVASIPDEHVTFL